MEGVAGEEPGLGGEEVNGTRVAVKWGGFPQGAVMNRYLVAVAVGLGASAAFASSPDPRDLDIPAAELVRARALVNQLGSDHFRDRENAYAELTKMGRFARPVLAVAVATDPDPEVRARAGRLLPRAAADDLKARIETFLADADGKYEHNLPGWSAYRKAAGADKLARDLFVEMVKSPASLEMLASLDRPAAVAGAVIADRRASMYAVLSRRFQGGWGGPTQSLTVPDVAALVVAETVVQTRDIPGGQFRFLNSYYFLQQAPCTSVLTGAGVVQHAEPFRKLVVEWMNTRVEPNDLANVAYLISNQLRGYKEVVPLLRKIVATEGVQGWAKGQAVTALIREEGKDAIPTLKSLLANESQLVTVWLGNNAGGNNSVMLQTRDLALAHLLTLHEQDLKSFGFEFPQGTSQALTATAFGSYAFPTDDARKAGFKKWAEIEKTLPKLGEKK